MLTPVMRQLIAMPNVVDVLANFRQEWEQVAEGASLVEIQGSIGLMLADLVLGLSLRSSEQVQVLGSTLYEELQSILVITPEYGKDL